MGTESQVVSLIADNFSLFVTITNNTMSNDVNDGF